MHPDEPIRFGPLRRFRMSRLISQNRLVLADYSSAVTPTAAPTGPLWQLGALDDTDDQRASASTRAAIVLIVVNAQ